MSTIEEEIKDIMETYVKDNPGCVQDKLIAYMAGYDRKLSHPVDPHSCITRSGKVIQGYLDELTGKKPVNKKPRIVWRPDPKNKQRHFLYINDQNLYNQVNQILSSIEVHIRRWNEPIIKINKIGQSKKQESYALNFKQNYVFPYYQLIGVMLRHLPSRIKIFKFSEEDFQSLNRKTMKLNEEFSEQIRGLEDLKDELVDSKNKLLKEKSELGDVLNHAGYVNDKMIDHLIETLEDFEKQFLS